MEQLKTRVALPNAHRTSGQGQASLRPEQTQPQKEAVQGGVESNPQRWWVQCHAGNRRAALSYEQPELSSAAQPA